MEDFAIIITKLHCSSQKTQTHKIYWNITEHFRPDWADDTMFDYRKDFLFLFIAKILKSQCCITNDYYCIFIYFQCFKYFFAFKDKALDEKLCVVAGGLH